MQQNVRQGGHGPFRGLEAPRCAPSILDEIAGEGSGRCRFASLRVVRARDPILTKSLSERADQRDLAFAGSSKIWHIIARASFGELAWRHRRGLRFAEQTEAGSD